MKSIFLLFISISGLLMSGHCNVKCKTGKGYDTIIFGSGGGFTGMVKRYTLNSQGVLTSDLQDSQLTSVPAKKLKEIYKKLDKAKAMDLSFNQPGNFYYFLELTKNGITNKIMWSDQNKAPQEIIAIYQGLMTLTNTEK